jgi:predicted O-methyltransferase YrrM
MIDQLLEEIHRNAVANDATATQRDRMMLNITKTTGQFLDLLIRECRPQRILEIGTSNGYSTIWIARAAESYNGKVVSVDLQAWKTELAEKNLQVALLFHHVQLHSCDASEFLSNCSPDEFDFVFLDADRSHYAQWAPSLFRVLRWGTMVVDNATSHPTEMSDFRAFVDQRSELESLVLPIGKGQLVIRKRSDDHS